MRLTLYEYYLTTELETNRELTLPSPGPISLSTAQCTLTPGDHRRPQRRSTEHDWHKEDIENQDVVEE